MRRVFGDSFYFIALLNARDSFHHQALDLTRQLTGASVVTTRWVLAEVGNALSGLGARRSFANFMNGLAHQDRVVVLPDSDALFQRGINLFAARADKEWSLTDCISFAAMHHERLQEALSGDHHFTQAGFHRLMG